MWAVSVTGVLICDDHRIVRQGIKQVLADAPEIRVVAEASDGQAALATALGTKTGTEALSHREHQVFRLLTLGQSVSEIGAQLKLAPNTVSTYRARILEKTGTKNNVELALYARNQSKG